LEGWGEPNHSTWGENRTARIDETVIGPLLAWALRFTFLARKLGCHPSTVRRSPLLADTAARTGVDTGTYLDTRPGYLLNRQPWLERIAYSTRGPDSLGTLAKMLQTACYILIAYLTGMRDSEIKHLTRGCASTERDSTGTAYRWKITSLAFKGEPPPAASWPPGSPGTPPAAPSPSWNTSSHPGSRYCSPACPTARAPALARPPLCSPPPLPRTHSLTSPPG
jgi:hypothetical protein